MSTKMRKAAQLDALRALMAHNPALMQLVQLRCRGDLDLYWRMLSPQQRQHIMEKHRAGAFTAWKPPIINVKIGYENGMQSGSLPGL
jgi:hypothetical protein